jgi:hypothetical protein
MIVTVTVAHFKDKKRLFSDVKLDPEITDSMERALGVWYSGGREYALLLAWSDRGCWTTMKVCLDELGHDGWEFVGTTPPLSQLGGFGRIPDSTSC